MFASRSGNSPSHYNYEPKSPLRADMPGRLNFGRIAGDPFALASISIATLAWLIAFVGSIVAQVEVAFVNYAWWCIVFYFGLLVGITLMIAADAVYIYRLACVAFLANGLFLTTSAVNALVYSSNGAAEAAAAGYLLLSIVTIIWIFYFGSEPEASHRRFIDSFALHKNSAPNRNTRQMTNPNFNAPAPNTFADRHPHSYASNNHLRGFETSSPIASGPHGGFGHSDLEAHGGNAPPSTGFSTGFTANHQPNDSVGIRSEGGDEVPAPTDYPYKARAIYSYDANPDDANEIGFQKHEILEVSDVSGRWWQARKANGETGIAPSNYLILL